MHIVISIKNTYMGEKFKLGTIINIDLFNNYYLKHARRTTSSPVCFLRVV